MAASLKKKIMGGYLVLVLIITVVGAWAVFNFARLNNTMIAITWENYRSIQAASRMIGALERQDSAELLLLLGETRSGSKMFQDSKAEFLTWFRLAESNITVPGEGRVIQGIHDNYEEYLTLYRQLADQQQTASIKDARSYYLNRIEPQFKLVRTQLEDLAQLNNETLVQRNVSANNEARGAIWSVLIVSVAAIFIGFIAGWRISEPIVQPVVRLTETVRMVGEGNWRGNIPVDSADEIGQLATEFNRMITRLRSYEETSLGKLMTERRKSETIVKVIDDGVMVLDEQYRLLLVNPSAEAIFNVSEERILGKQFLEAINQRDIFARLEEALKRAQGRMTDAGKTGVGISPERENEPKFRQTFAVKDGQQTRYYQLEIIPIEGPADKVAGLVVVFKDITFFKELDRLKTEFISNVSHELRTPLTSMTMGIGILKESSHIPPQSREAEVLEAVREETSRMNHLVNQLLDLSRLEAGGTKMYFQPVDVNELLENAVNLFKVPAEQQKIRLEVSIEPGLPPIWADYDKVLSVLSNLLGNALRYATAGDVITVEVRTNKGSALFAVKDTGPGIPPQVQAKIFDKFFQVKGRPGGGAGLGLAISKEIVEAHRGHIWLVSEEGKGAAFFFTVPLAPAGK